jgi:hypothetical protein
MMRITEWSGRCRGGPACGSRVVESDRAQVNAVVALKSKVSRGVERAWLQRDAGEEEGKERARNCRSSWPRPTSRKGVER